MSGEDLLADAVWECAEADAGAPGDGPPDGLHWIPAPVPGTVAQARARNGGDVDLAVDDRDWWYRTRLVSPGAVEGDLIADGLAGIAEIALNGERVASSDDMFLGVRAPVRIRAGENTLTIRFRSLEAELAGRRPRPRWRVARLAHPQLRWARQSLLGRLRGVPPTPAPVGPWRPLRLVPSDAIDVLSTVLRTTPIGSGGAVDVRVDLAGWEDQPLAVEIAGERTDAGAVRRDGGWVVEATIELERVDRWWPRSAGAQRLYPVALHAGERRFELGRVGFREVGVDTSAGGFRFVVNGVPLFVGGAVWMPADPVGLSADRDVLEPLLATLSDAGVTMLRVPGDTVYESDAFYDLCDELGLMVWQDCALAFSDPPADPDWEARFLAEAAENVRRIARHPSLALVSGGTEIAQQATYAGVSLADGLPLLTERLPAVVRAEAPSIPYLPTSPWGGDVVTRPDTGVSHYYGVGAYLRGPEDARRARPRFAAETLAFAVPPQREAVERDFGGPQAAGHDPAWKRAIFRDAGAAWDFEDVRDHYVATGFDVDPLAVRRSDPDRYLELGRAAVARLVEGTFAEWRPQESGSGGGLVFYSHDALPGAGLGLLDASGEPKSSWYALRRALAPVAVSVSDEGLNGLVAHLHNARPQPVSGSLEVELIIRGELVSDRARRDVELPAFGSIAVGVDGMFEGFRDAAWSHRFGPLTYDVVVVALDDPDGMRIAETVTLPAQGLRPVDPDLGLAVVVEGADDTAVLTIRSRRLAQFVSIDAPGWRPDDSGFDLPPGRDREVRLHRVRDGAALRGTLHVLNGHPVPFSAPMPPDLTKESPR